MKLVIVTAVEDYKKAVLDLFKRAQIESFSGSEIEGYKSRTSVLSTASWFLGEKGGVDSKMIFSFTEDQKIEILFNLIRDYNRNYASNNPIKAVVVPIEKSI